MPTAFRAAVLRDGALRLEEHVLPPRSRGEIDVDVTIAAVCGSDLHTVSGRRATEPGTGLGHEAVGRVGEADEGATDARGAPIRRGDRVVFGMIVSCGSCDRCSSGLPMKCRTLRKYGHASVDAPPHAVAMLADVVRLVPGVTVLRAPDLPDELLVSAACAVPTAAAIVRALGDARPTRVGVVGGGAVGTYVAEMLIDRGSEVLLLEPDAVRRRSLSEGVVAVGALPRDLDATVEVSGSASGTTAALEACGVGGTVVLAGTVSPAAVRIDVDPSDIVLRRIRVSGIHNYAPEDLIAGVDWLETRGARAPRVLGQVVPLERVAEAFRAAERHEALRIGVRP
jgi:threonine 3-dehydrogenase